MLLFSAMKEIFINIHGCENSKIRYACRDCKGVFRYMY